MKGINRILSAVIAVFMLMQTAICMAADTASESIECPCAVKVCYDLGFLPNVYDDADKIVTYDEFVDFYRSFTGDNYELIKPKKNITLEQVYTAFCYYGISNKSINDSFIEDALRAGYSNDVFLDREANITYSQLAKIIYNVLNGIKLEHNYNSYGAYDQPDTQVRNGILFKQGYVKYTGEVTVAGDKATVNGRLYDWKNYEGTEAKDVVLNISDKDLTSGSGYILFVKDDTIVSAISSAEEKKESVVNDMTPPTVIMLTIGDVNASVNGESVVNDVAPMVVNDRTMLPIRFVAEALGATVGWNESSQKVSIKSRKADISIKIGEKYASVIEYKQIEYNPTEQVELDSPAFIENDRTYLPLRFIAEKLGADVSWDEATQTVTITKK